MARLGQDARVGHVGQPDQVFVQPQAVGLLGGDLLLEFLVRHDSALFGVNQKHAARLQPVFLQHPLRRDVEHPHLAGHDDQVVFGHVIARRAQAVAVEHRPNLLAVGKGDRGRAVPRLHQAGVVLVKGPLFRAHALVFGPRLRNHHHHRVRQRPPAQDQQLQAIVEHGRVAPVGADDGQELADVIPEEVGLEHRLAGVHPVDIAPQGVDLPVVGQVTIGMRPVPARERVGAEARVHQRQRRFHRRVLQVRVILPQLRRQQHPFIDQRLVRKARDVEKLAPRHLAGVADGILSAPADDIKLALEGHVLRQSVVPPDEHLAHQRFARPRGLAHRRIVGGNRAPSQDLLSFLGHDLAKELLAFGLLRTLRRQKDHADPVGPGAGQRNPPLPSDQFQELVRRLDEDAGPVARIGLAAARAPVVQVQQRLKRLPDDAMRPAALDIDDETDSAGFVLELRVIKARSGRQPGPPGLAFLVLTVSSTAHFVGDSSLCSVSN